ncbi:putative phospholipid:diacylglycerol acyltransferase 1 [Iris pallida]|uniref:Phospholipid:diacylglycerol acyltransferase 1 n=1 Tax=Iris pallida TaxID=29817 RepID=A0AAX6GIX4_IRIPA|nr:putative phospholipid:diacylglycerol acyltransferase 1 [Iris pallida]
MHLIWRYILCMELVFLQKEHMFISYLLQLSATFRFKLMPLQVMIDVCKVVYTWSMAMKLYQS